MNYKLLPKNTPLFLYEQLDDKAKSVARKGIIQTEIDAYLRIFLNLSQENIHSVINRKGNPIRLLNHKHKMIKRYSLDIPFCEKWIKENLCNFTKDGTHITYCI